MSNKSDKKPAGEFEQLREMNEKLLISSVRQHEMTERAKKAERTASESEALYRALFDSAPMAVFVCDRNAVIQHYNTVAVELWGREPTGGVERHCGSTKLWLLNGELLPHAQSPVVEVLRTGISALNVEIYIERPDGSRLPVLVNFAALKDKNGEITGAITSFIDITQRKLAENVLQESENRLRTMADSIPQLAWMAEPDGFIFWYNSKWYEYTGTTPEQMEGWGWQSVHDPEILPKVLVRWKRSISTGEPFEMEFPILGADGVFRWFLTRVNPLRDHDGKIVRWFGTNTDIDDSRRIQEALRESEERFAKAFNASPLSITITNLKTGKLVEVNDTFVAITGYSRSEAIGRTTAELGLWEDTAHREAELEMIASAGSLRQNEYHFRMKDGSEILGLLSAEFIEIGGEHCALTVIQDITERSKADMALRKSEERFTRFMHHLPGLAWIKDVEGRYVYANDAAADAFNTATEELYGKTDDELFTPETAARFHGNDEQALEKSSGVQTVETLEHEDGTVHHSIVSKFPIPDADGRTALIGGMAIDITDRMQAENALRESEEKFRILSEAAPALIWFDDPDGNCVYVNQQYLDFAGKTMDELKGTGRHLFLHPEDQEAYVADFRDAQRERRPFHHRARALRRDGAWRWIESFARPLFGSDGVYLGHVGVSPDISATVEAEIILHLGRENLEMLVAERTAELADAHDNIRTEAAERLLTEKERVRLLNQIVTTQEDERRRIARDLHDELGQQLTALRLKLLSAKEMCDDEAVCDEIDDIQKIAERLDTDVSFLARELHPSRLDETGLTAGLSAYVKEWARFSDVVADFHAAGLGRTRLSPEIETNLYRIAQEALNNTRKHSKAKNVSVLLEKRKDGIILIIEDDGVAFDTEAKLKRSKGLGLIGMHERAGLLGGTLEIESSRGSGTTIFVRIPSEPPAVAGG